MTGDIWGQILIIMILIFVNAFFAASEMAIVSVKSTKIKAMMDDGNKKAAIINKFMQEPSKLLATIQIGITFSGFLASAIGAQAVAANFGNALEATGNHVLVQYGAGVATVLVTVIIAFITLVLGELAPKRIAIENSEKIAMWVAYPINFLAKAAYPAVRFLTYSTGLVTRLLGSTDKGIQDHITEEEIRLMINVGEEKGIFQGTETEMINSIFEFDDTEVKEVMTPRTDMKALDVNDSLEDILDLIIDENFSRVPVYEETVDKIIGILYTKDLFPIIRNGDEGTVSLRSLIRDAHFVSEYKKINELFKEMQKSKSHIAIVIDEYGGTAGLITIEDLLEEIVGNIFDEYDEEIVESEKIDDNTWIVSGMIDIDEINNILDTEIPEDEFDTISGKVLSLTGKMPVVGDVVEFDGLVVKIIEVDDKRISKLEIKRVYLKEEPEEDASEE